MTLSGEADDQGGRAVCDLPSQVPMKAVAGNAQPGPL